MARPLEGETLTVTHRDGLDAVADILVGVEFDRDAPLHDPARRTVEFPVDRTRGMYRGAWTVRFHEVTDWTHERRGEHRIESVARIDWDAAAKRFTLPMVLDRAVIDVRTLRVDVEDRTPGRLSPEERLARVPDDIREWREKEERAQVAMRDRARANRVRIARRAGITYFVLGLFLSWFSGFGGWPGFLGAVTVGVVLGSLGAILVFRAWEARLQGFVLGLVTMAAMLATGAVFSMVFFAMLIVSSLAIALAIGFRGEADMAK